jgi:hypothetical protein
VHSLVGTNRGGKSGSNSLFHVINAADKPALLTTYGLLLSLLRLSADRMKSVGWSKRALQQTCYSSPGKNIISILNIRIKELHGLSPRANYTDRATAACRRSDCKLFTDRGCHVVSVINPYGRILGFLNRSRYFSIK